MLPDLSGWETAGVNRPSALPQKSSFNGFGFANCCEAWLCPAVSELRFSSGLRPQALELETHRRLSPKPIIASTRQGRAMPHNSWQSRIQENSTFEAKPFRAAESGTFHQSTTSTTMSAHRMAHMMLESLSTRSVAEVGAHVQP